MASGVYNNFKAEVMSKSYDMSSGGDSHKVALLNNTHTFVAENDVWTDVSANEIAGTGYTAAGQVLAGQTVTIDDIDDEGVWDATDIAWGPGASFSAYHAVIYNDTVTDDLVLSIDFSGIQTVTSGTFTIVWATEGILNFT